jgi:hypothetical protein
VNNLPQTLTHLTFGCYFNQSVDKLPETLTHLTLGDKFNKSVNYLPKNIKNLKLMCDNNLINKLPDHIKKLYVVFYAQEKFNKNIINLPTTIDEIVIENEFYKKYFKNIPFGVKFTFMSNKNNKLVKRYTY